MKNRVSVRVYGSQEIDGEKDSQQTRVMGEYYVKDGRRYVLYGEMMEDGGKVRTLVKETRNGIIVVKNGYISVRMNFCEGLTDNSIYITPMGKVNLGTTTKYINKTEKENGFIWEFGYSIYMDGQYVGENVLGLEVELG
ncbi:MAG: DUF1934 domain-containing protein [Lachnospiraceae bacterium]|nr:DUF1934 domain-containing protein [Lachnospiraceae bacterium]